MGLVELLNESDFAVVDEVVTEAKEDETIIQKAREKKERLQQQRVKATAHPKP